MTSVHRVISYYGDSAAWWLGRLPRDPDILGSRPALPTVVEFDSGSTWFIFSAALVNRELVCLRPVVFVFAVLSFRSLCFIGPEKPRVGSD